MLAGVSLMITGFEAGLTLWGLLRASNGRQVVTLACKEANQHPLTQKSAILLR